MAKLINEKKITAGVYLYTYDTGDEIMTCGSSPRAVFDLCHPNHDKGGIVGNCYLNGVLMSLKGALSYVENK